MQLSNAPGKIVLPFANGGGKNTIPTASQIGITAGAASLTDGFPPLTRTPVAAGGVPPSGLDMNGILFEISAAIRWATAGAGYLFDSTFSADGNVGGYPKGSRVLRSDGAGYWLSTTDNNTTDPEAAGSAAAGWVPDLVNGIAAVTMTNANVTLTALQYGKPIIVLSGLLTANLNLIFPNMAGEWTVVNNCTGAFVVTCKTAAGTGVIVVPGHTQMIYGDATNIGATTLDAIRHSGPLVVNATGALSASTALGNLIIASGNGAPITLTLPLAASCYAGGIISFLNASAFDVTISRAGADLINPSTATVTSIVLKSGDTLSLSLFSGVWEGFSGSALLPFAPGFASSLGTPGWRKLPSGEIEQWGSVSGTVAGTAVTFPITFPSAVYQFSAFEANGNVGLTNVSTGTPTGSGGTIYTGAGPVTVNWVARGK